MDDVDQLLDDALEESYRSVLETDQSSHSSMSNPSSMVNPGNDKKPHNGGGSNLVCLVAIVVLQYKKVIRIFSLELKLLTYNIFCIEFRFLVIMILLGIKA